MIETTRIPARHLTRMQLQDWPVGSLVLDPGTTAIGIVGSFLNASRTALDRPGFLCLTSWTNSKLQSGDIYVDDDDIKLWGVSSDDLSLGAEVELLDLAPSTTLNSPSNGAVLMVGRTGMAIAGMRNRQSATQRGVSGLNLLGMASALPDNGVIVSSWTLIIKLNEEPSSRLAVKVGTGT